MKLDRDVHRKTKCLYSFVRAAAICIPLASSGCGLTGLELEQATDPLADSIPHMLSAQIAHNLILKDENQFQLPAQVVIGAGSSQVSNQLILPTVAASSVGRLFGALTVQNQNQWQQGWSVSAVTDVGDLERLDALYRYAWRKEGLCDFVIKYASAAINAPSSPVLRLTDFDDVSDPNNQNVKKARLQDFNYPDPPAPDYHRPVGTLPMHDFGPPAELPLPPSDAVKACVGAKSDSERKVAALSLRPDEWPVPFPDQTNFIWISGTCHEPDTRHWVSASDPQFLGTHEMRNVYVDQARYAQFQVWVLGATVNTTSASKGGGGNPSKGISGSNG